MMNTLIRSEWLKQRSTRTAFGLFAAMLGLVLSAVLLHSLLPADQLADRHTQLMVLGRGEFLGALFAALLGAMSITAEIRHGTIRPTLLFSPRRDRVVGAKAAVSVAIGAGFGLVAGGAAVAAGAAAVRAGGIELRLDGGDYAWYQVSASFHNGSLRSIPASATAKARNRRGRGT